MNRSANLQDYRQLAERLCRRIGIEAPGNHPVDILRTLERYCEDDATMDTQPKPLYEGEGFAVRMAQGHADVGRTPQADQPQAAKRGRPRNDNR